MRLFCVMLLITFSTSNFANTAPTKRKPIPDIEINENEGIESIDLSQVFNDVDMKKNDESIEYCIYLGSVGNNIDCPKNLETTQVTLNIEKSLLTTTVKKNQHTNNSPLHVFVVAKDSQNQRVDDEFNITINNINNPPYIKKRLPGLRFSDERKFEISLTEHFGDLDGQQLVYNYEITQGRGLFTKETSIDKKSGKLKLFLTGDDGIARVKVSATDDAEKMSQTASDIFDVTIDNNYFSANCKPFCFDFVTGYEGTSVDEINEKGNSRIEFISQLWVSAGSDSSNEIHLSGNILQTSAASQMNNTSNDSSEKNIESKAEIKTAIEANFTAGYFYPSWALESTNLLDSHRPGFIATFGGVKVKDEDFSRKYYIGIRSEHNHLQYLDVLYGKTEGIKGRRVEFRGQLPISKKFLIGFSLNIGVKDKQEKTDSIKFYISIPTSTLGLFKT